jgi:heat shock protein HslJ
MRALLALLLMVVPAMSKAEDLTGIDWLLIAVDGVVFEAETTLHIEADGAMHGRAPCNRWSAANRAMLPKLDLGVIRSTRMACPQLAEEQAFFAALVGVTDARVDGTGSLILSSPDGRTLEFIADRTD